MTHPPQIIQVPGVGTEVAQGLEPLLRALQLRQQLAIERDKLDIQRELAKQKQKQEDETGKMLAQFIGALDTHIGQSPVPHVVGPAGHLPLGGDYSEVPSPAPVPQGGDVIPMPQYAQPQTPQPQAPVQTAGPVGGLEPYAALQQAVRFGQASGFTPAAMKDVLTTGGSIASNMLTASNNATVAELAQAKFNYEQQQQAQADTAYFTALGRIKDQPSRDVFSMIYLSDRQGHPIDMSALRTLYPGVFPKETAPAQVQNFIDLMKSPGNWSAAQAADIAGIKLPPSVDPNFRYPLVGSGRLNQQQMILQLSFNPMKQANDLLVGHQGPNGVWVPGLQDTAVMSPISGLYRDLVSSSSSGGIGGLLTSIATIGLNYGLTPEQQNLIQAQFAYMIPYVYLVSGKQSTDSEKRVIMRAINWSPGDGEAVKAQKNQFREMVLQTVAQVANGTMTRTQAAQAVQNQALTTGLGGSVPNLLQTLQDEVNNAQQLDSAGVDPTADIPDVTPLLGGQGPGIGSAAHQRADSLINSVGRKHR
jgi:hypothetical protein